MTMGLPMGLAMASGLNTYLPLLLLSLFARFGNVVHLSPRFQWLISDQTIIVLSILVLCEVLADKFPGMDHVWDFIHTLLRPVAGALAAGATVSTDNIFEMALVMLLGGSLATAAHTAKATVRLASSTKTLGVANPILSIVEDVTSLVASLFAVYAPWLMAIIAVLFVITTLLLGPPLWRTLRFNLGALAGGLRWCGRKIIGSASPRDLEASVLEIAPGRLGRLRQLLENGEELLGALEGWRRTGWGPRRNSLLITSRQLILVERRFPGRIRTQTLPYSDVQLVRERGSMLVSRLEILSRQKQDVLLIVPKTQAESAGLAAHKISELSGLGQERSATPRPKLAAATP
ncbi:MAG: DUF4126 domain-containing protein [Acidobacteria bacterium]|nr:DUF4126 domain-containing protein [Acidobacteriota bacterium]